MIINTQFYEQVPRNEAPCPSAGRVMCEDRTSPAAQTATPPCRAPVEWANCSWCSTRRRRVSPAAAPEQATSPSWTAWATSPATAVPMPAPPTSSARCTSRPKGDSQTVYPFPKSGNMMDSAANSKAPAPQAPSPRTSCPSASAQNSPTTNPDCVIMGIGITTPSQAGG